MRRVITITILLASCTLCLAQRGYRGPEFVMDRRGVPDWEIDEEYPEDVFTFVRIMFNPYDGWGKWRTDYPDSDLNFSFRLQQLTSLKVKWKVYLNLRSDIERAIRYVEENPIKEGKPRQKWSFVAPLPERG